MKKFIRVPYEEESRFSYEETKKRLASALAEQKKLQLYKLKGAALFLLSEKENDEYTLSYYHSYKTDFCDTCLRFYLEKGLERCNVKGFFCKPRAVWGFFWGTVATLLIDFLVITYCILFTADFDLTNALLISGTAVLLRAYICLSLVQFDKRRLKAVKEEMLRLIRREETEMGLNEGEAAENEGN